jgi:hypothetical protein
MAFSSFFKTKKPIETRRQQRDALAARLSSAEADVVTAREACTGAAVEGATDAELAKVEFAKRQAEDRVQSLTGALQAFDSEIAAQAAKEVADADRKAREATARELCGRADKIEKGLTPLLAAVRNSAADIETSRQIVGEIGIFELFARLGAELPPAFALIAGELRTRAAMTIDGHAPAALPVPEVVIPPVPPIPRTRVFALQNLRWTDPETHRPALCERFDVCALPNGLAELAMSKDLAIDPELDRARELIKQRRGAPPLREKCYDLDHGGEAPKSPRGQVPWNIEVVNRGPPTRMSLAPPPSFEPAAARSIAPPTNNNEPDHGE